MEHAKEISVLPLFNEHYSFESASPEKVGICHVEELLNFPGGFKVAGFKTGINFTFKGTTVQDHD